MAVVFVEGFDYYNGLGNSLTAVGAATRWSLTGNISLAAGRFGGQALYIISNGTSTDFGYCPLDGSYPTGTLGFAVQLLTIQQPGFADPLISIGTQLYIYPNPDGALTIRRGTTPLATTAPGLITVGAWNYIELEYVISTTVGMFNLYLNGSLVLSASGINTQALGTNTTNIITVTSNNTGGTNLAGWLLDDMYVADTATRLGEQRVVTSYPTSDALTTFWSSSTGGAAPYTMIDETLCDGDTTYASSNTFNSRLVVGMPTLPVVPVNVNAVQIVGFARKDETQFRQLALEYENTAGAVSTGASYTLGGSYTRMENLMPQNPLTAAPWTATDVNSMKIGARVVS